MKELIANQEATTMDDGSSRGCHLKRDNGEGRTCSAGSLIFFVAP